MSGFYKPFTTNVDSLPIIVYPCVGLENVVDRTNNSLFDHLNKLYKTNEEILKTGTYHILILWDEASDDPDAKSRDVMTDVWIFDKIDSWRSGPLVDTKIFRNMRLETGIGISAGDGLLMLGREEELRRSATSLEEYLFGERPELPLDVAPTEYFIK